MDEPTDDPGPGAPDPSVGGLRGIAARSRARFEAGRSSATSRFERHRHRPLVDLGLRIYERDRQAAGSIVGSAIAFRLFLFFVPMLLFLVGLAGFFADHVTRDDVAETGITGNLARQIESALTQPNSTRWIAVTVGFVGMATTGRTLSKVLSQASCLAWGMPVRASSSAKIVGGIIGLLVGMGLVAGAVNRVRQEFGLAASGLSFLAVFVVYLLATTGLVSMLPRPTSDPGVLLPGAALVAVILTALQAVSQLYLPDRFSRASELYGAIGATVVTLGWFFFAGRALVLGMVVDAAVFERFGSVTSFVFGLPVVRILPRRSAWVRRRFDLPEPDERAGPDPPA